MTNEFKSIEGSGLWFAPFAGQIFATEGEANAANREAHRDTSIAEVAEACIAERLAALVDEGSDSDSLWMAPVAGNFFPTQVEAICANERAIAERDYEALVA